MGKTRAEWVAEAENFVEEFVKATGKAPVYVDVLAVCADVIYDAADVVEYADMLWTYVVCFKKVVKMKFETKLKKILDMPDSDLKLTILQTLGLKMPTRPLDTMLAEEERLSGLGYKDLALIYLEPRKERTVGHDKEKDTSPAV